MESQRSSGTGSGNSDTYTAEIAESLRFEEVIQSLIHPSFDGSPRAGGSFTALLGLPANQAVELLHEPGPGVLPVSAAASSSPTAAELWRVRLGEHAVAAPLHLPFGCSPFFSSDAGLMERAAQFSVFTTHDSPASSSCGGPPPTLKEEAQDSDSPTFLPIPDEKPQRVPKRKSKAKANKSAKANTGGEKLPYVHVRARRGQATDSHSLAERARREKISARMKLLQELVPGCSKITGTTSVLDEIINHVQCLQRQVELLSMRLATVNPRIDISGLDCFLSTECGSLAAGDGRYMALNPATWPSEAAAVANGTRRLPQQQQFLQFDLVGPQQSPALLERESSVHGHSHRNPDTSLYVYDWTNTVEIGECEILIGALTCAGVHASDARVPQNSNQAKTEL